MSSAFDDMSKTQKLKVAKNILTTESTLGQKAADFAAAKIGSWTFLIVFNCMMLMWIAANVHFGKDAFDPFPFILLNLCLSWLAGVQAPLIMIAQNRQEQIMKDTVDSIHVIGKATLEIAESTKDLLQEHTEMLEEISEEDSLEDLEKYHRIKCSVCPRNQRHAPR